MNRRAFVGTAVLALAGCGDKRFANQSLKAAQKRAVAIDYASYYAPIEDVRRLVRARAHNVGAQLTLSDDPAGVAAQVANLKRWTASQGDFRAIAVAPFDAAAVAPVVAGAKGVAIVSFITAIEGQAAAITVDQARAGARLAALAPDGPVLLVAPPEGAAVPSPFAPGWAAAARAIGRTLTVEATVAAQAVDDARAAVAAALSPAITGILCWNDACAQGAAQAAGGRWVGALGAPGLSGSDSITALRRGRIDALVTPRLRDLTDALVDLPLAYASGGDPGSKTVPFVALGRRSRALDAFASDFAA